MLINALRGSLIRIPLISSFQIRAGPPSILFVAGWRVRHIPAVLRPFDTVMLCPWAQDPQEISTAALLPALNGGSALAVVSKANML